jgi:hypothetical protein
MKERFEFKFGPLYVDVLKYFNTDTEIKLDFTRTVKKAIRAHLAGVEYSVPMHKDIKEAAETRNPPLTYTVPIYSGEEDVAEYLAGLPRGKRENIIGRLLRNAFAKHIKGHTDSTVDSTVPHELDEGFDHTKPAAFMFRKKRVECKRWGDFLPLLMEEIAAAKPDKMKRILAAGKKGRGNNYYWSKNTDSPDKMRALKNVKGYVHCKLGAKQAAQLSAELLTLVGYSPNDLQVFLRSDFRERHKKT